MDNKLLPFVRLLGWLLSPAPARAQQPLSVSSPDGKLQLTFVLNPSGQLTYSFRADGRELLEASRVGLEGQSVAGSSRRSVESVWKPVWGKRAVVPERFNELTLELQKGRLMARAYDDGVAFRPLISGSPLGRTEFAFAGDYTAWFYNGESHNLGPQKLSDVGDDRMPVMTIEVDKGCYLAVHEAALDKG